MGLKVLLTVDLENGVTSDQRKIFNEKLKELNWIKITSLTTTWRASFSDTTSISSALSETKNDVKSAATVGRITTYHCAVQFGTDGPFTFSS